LDLEERIIQLLANLNAVRPDKALEKKALKENLKTDDDAMKSVLKGLQIRGYLMEEGEKVYLTVTGIIRAFSYYS
jgi:hypothetical protein